ncbi:MAG: glycosyltransferase family 39 protein [Acidobacteria bacterium]|nr:glycosyltransferase family 39 protein [Acidobacteriota bacterium]
MKSRYAPYVAGLLVCSLFIGLGLIFIPYPGAQYDEVLFVSAIYRPDQVEATMNLPWLGRVPIMLMTYLGTLKAAIYVPILKLLWPSHYTLRGPMLLAGALSIWLFFLALRRLAGNKAALLASLLLATDSIYLLTCIFDWGPVALQHLFFTLTFYLLLRYCSQPRPLWLFLAGLACGLAMWDKALFIWSMAGFGIALTAFLPKQLWAVARDRRMLGAIVLGFVLGSAPFLFYNARNRGRTFTANTESDEQNALTKLGMLDRTMDGIGLMGYLSRDSVEGPAQNMKSWEPLPIRARNLLRAPRQSWQHLLLVFCLLAAPALCWSSPNRKLTLIVLLGGLLTYLLMISTRRAGGSAHHTILLWPTFHLLVGLAAGAVFSRWQGRVAKITVALVLGCSLSNLMVLNTYLADFIEFGPGISWNDASRALINELGKRTGRMVFCTDWGVLNQMDFYSRGKIGMHPASDGMVLGLPDASNAEQLNLALSDPKFMFVTMAEGKDLFPNNRKKFLDFAAAQGYQRHLMFTIRDRHTAPTFEVYEFTR